MVSDFILGIFAFYFFYMNRTLNKNWGFFFLFVSIAAFVGSAFHGGFIAAEYARFVPWTILSASLIFAQLATYEKVNSKTLNLFFVFKSALFLSLAISYSEFLFMVTDIAISLLGFVVIGNSFFIKGISNKISLGIIISISSAIIVVLKLNIHPEYLTANDIGHYISIISLLYISKGIGESSYYLKAKQA